MDIATLLQPFLTPTTARTVASSTGITQTSPQLIQTALSTLVQGLAQNTQTTDGTQALWQALDRHTDATSDIAKQLAQPNITDGTKILTHIFGGEKDTIVQKIARTNHIDQSQIERLLATLAPAILNLLGTQKRTGSLRIDDVNALLQPALANNTFTKTLTQLLDTNKDGSILDDIIHIAMRFFQKRTV